MNYKIMAFFYVKWDLFVDNDFYSLNIVFVHPKQNKKNSIK